MATERPATFRDGYLPMRDAVVSPDAANYSIPDRRTLGFTPQDPTVRKQFEDFLAQVQAKRR